MEERNYEVSLGQLCRVALKHWWVILIAVILGVVLAVCYVSFLATPMYTTHAKVGVSNLNMSAYQEYIGGQTVSKDCETIITSNGTLEMAAESLNKSEEAAKFGKVYTHQSLVAMMQTSGTDQSRYIEVKVTSDNPEEAKMICDHILIAFSRYLEEENPLNGAEGQVIHHPDLPTAPSSPNKSLTVILGALIGFVLSLGALLVAYFAKDALDGEDWLIDSYREHIPMLSVIPDADSSGKSYKKYSSKYGYGYSPKA